MVSLGSVSALWFSLERGFSPFRKESFPGECSRSVAVAPSLQSYDGYSRPKARCGGGCPEQVPPSAIRSLHCGLRRNQLRSAH